MKKRDIILVVIIVVLVVTTCITITLYNRNSIQGALGKYDISYNEVILTHKFDDKLVFIFQDNKNQGLDLFGALTFKKTKLGFCEYSYEITDMQADIAFINVFLSDIDNQEDVLFIGQIVDQNIHRIEFVWESDVGIEPEYINVSNKRFFIYSGKQGRYSFLKYDKAGIIINQ